MTKNLQEALDNADMTYNQLVEIANDIIEEYTRDIDVIIKGIVPESLSNDDLRNVMVSLSLKAFRFGDIKEKSSLKAECAEILRKESYAKAFNGSEGSVAIRENSATLGVSNEILTETIYNLIADLFKVKLDEIHRIVSVLQTVLTSRLSEAKLMAGNGTV